jgi:hypothetical protein
MFSQAELTPMTRTMGLIEQGKAVRRSRERLNRTAAALADLDAERQLLSRKRSQSTANSSRGLGVSPPKPPRDEASPSNPTD